MTKEQLKRANFLKGTIEILEEILKEIDGPGFEIRILTTSCGVDVKNFAPDKWEEVKASLVQLMKAKYNEYKKEFEEI